MGGYFDGDGSVLVFVWKYVVALYLDFSDQCGEQLQQIVEFMRIQGIPMGAVRKMTNASAYSLRIADQKSVVEVAERMIPFCFKKRRELVALLEYRKLDAISGLEVQRRFASFVELGFRERHGQRMFKPQPWAYTVGYRLSRKGNGLLSHSYRLLRALSEAQKREARERHKVFGESISALAKSYGISRSAMWGLLKDA